MKHYIVLCEYCVDGESGVDIIGVRHSESDALEMYRKQLQIERENAENNCYDAIEEDNKSFIAYEDGDYCMNHIALYVEESEK